MCRESEVLLFYVKLIHNSAQPADPGCPLSWCSGLIISPWFCSDHPHPSPFSQVASGCIEVERNSLDLLVTVNGLSYLYSCVRVLGSCSCQLWSAFFICHLWEFDFLLPSVADARGLFFFWLARTAWHLSCSGCLSSALTGLLSPLRPRRIFCVSLHPHGTLSLSPAATGAPSPAAKGPLWQVR